MPTRATFQFHSPRSGRPQLPTELWHAIIDILDGSLRQQRGYIPNQVELHRVRTLTTCALVCHSWSSRIQTHLYPIAWVRTGKNLWSLTRTLRSSPHLASLVCRLVVAPREWMSLDDPITDYLPIIPFLSIPSAITHIQLINVSWIPIAFRGAYDQGFCNRSIVRLELISIIAPSISSIFPLIYSCRCLTHLALVGIHLQKQATEEETARLQQLASRYPMESLISLEVGGNPGIAVIHLFGENIQYLRLFLQFSDPVSPSFEHYREVLSRYRALKALSVILEPWMDLQAPLAGSEDEGVRVWGPIHQYFLSLLRSISSPRVLQLEVQLVPQQQQPEQTQLTDGSEDGRRENPWDEACRYRHTRMGIVDTLFTSDIRDVLRNHPFEDLRRFDFVVTEHSSAKSTTFWHTTLEQRLGLREGVLQVDINDSDEETHVELWG